MNKFLALVTINSYNIEEKCNTKSYCLFYASDYADAARQAEEAYEEDVYGMHIELLDSLAVVDREVFNNLRADKYKIFYKENENV